MPNNATSPGAVRSRGKVPARTRRGNPDSAPLAVCILAGGQSSRMGRDKARLRLGGRPLLAHARSAARSLGLDVRVIRRDIIANCGPLSGVHTALASSRADAELFLACDMPFIAPSLLRRLMRRLRPGHRAVFSTVDRLAGFPFIIRSNCAGLVKEQILQGRLSLQDLARALGAPRLEIPQAERPGLLNINTPADYARARARARARASV